MIWIHKTPAILDYYTPSVHGRYKHNQMNNFQLQTWMVTEFFVLIMHHEPYQFRPDSCSVDKNGNEQYSPVKHQPHLRSGQLVAFSCLNTLFSGIICFSFRSGKKPCFIKCSPVAPNLNNWLSLVVFSPVPVVYSAHKMTIFGHLPFISELPFSSWCSYVVFTFFFPLLFCIL